MRAASQSIFVARSSLGFALILAGAWALLGWDVEAWVTTFGLLAAVMGLLVEPWLRRREQRRGLLRDLARELVQNVKTLHDPVFSREDEAFHIYPRVMTIVSDAALSSGQFSGGTDGTLLALLNEWAMAARGFNGRLDLTELLTATNPELRATFHRRLSRGEMLDGVRRKLLRLGDHLLQSYEGESGIGLKSELFGLAEGIAREP